MQYTNRLTSNELVTPSLFLSSMKLWNSKFKFWIAQHHQHQCHHYNYSTWLWWSSSSSSSFSFYTIRIIITIIVNIIRASLPPPTQSHINPCFLDTLVPPVSTLVSRLVGQSFGPAYLWGLRASSSRSSSRWAAMAVEWGGYDCIMIPTARPAHTH